MRYALRRWPALGVVVGSQCLKVGLDLLKPWPMAFLVDYVLRGLAMPAWLAAWVHRLPGGTSPDALVAWSVLATVLIFILSWVVGLAIAVGNVSLGQRMTYDLAGDLFTRFQQLSLSFHARKSVGDSLRRVTSDCTCVSVIVKDALLPVFASVLSLVALFSVLWRIDAILTLLALGVVPGMVLVFRFYAVPMMDNSYRQQEAEGKVYDLVEQTFAAMPLMQAFCREKSNDQQFVATTQNALAITLALTRLQLGFKVLMGLTTALGTAGILWLGTQHALEGRISLGAIIAFLSYLGSLYGPLEAVMYTSSTIQGAAGSARRVMEILHTETELNDLPGAKALPVVRGEVRYEDVTFGYEAGRPILRKISLDIEPGETIALVGATGAGKSTMVSLLPRFYDPWEGRVSVDGQDVRDVQLKTLRSQIAMVLQEPFLFPLTIAENIAYGRPHASLSDIEAAARAAEAHDFISRLPDGYQTLIGERGATLSGGERQRLSIARALLKDAPILILDEPTSSVDAQTEHGLMTALKRLTMNRTTFIIAHRLATVRGASRIVSLDQGRIAEIGTHEQLISHGGVYAKFYEMQFNVASGPKTP
jgi:ATP-binding cassette subfamily B protein